MKKLHPVMLAGTGSDVGKSVIAAALCRIFRQDGYHPAPFKAQNMALNSYATPDGLEIGRAQAVQAEAAGIPCHTDMNPLLLKPQSDHTSQVILNGRPLGNKDAYDYWRKKPVLPLSRGSQRGSEQGNVEADQTTPRSALPLCSAKNPSYSRGEKMRQYIRNHTPFFGNDDEYADSIAVRVYDDLVKAIEGRPNTRGGKTQLNMLSTTCHNYFGQVCGATPNGRFAHFAISDGTSPAHGSDTHGPTAVIKSLGKLDQTKSGGTLLNVRFVPNLLKREEDQKKLASLIRSYFKMGGHHIQFNIIDTATLHDAQQHPEEYRDLLVRVAGYSDYFNDMTEQLQNEIIARTENSEY